MATPTSDESPLGPFPSDYEWVKKQLSLTTESKKSENSVDSNEQRWGFLEPEDGHGPILEFHRGTNEYNIVVHPFSSNLIVRPGSGERHIINQTVPRWLNHIL